MGNSHRPGPGEVGELRSPRAGLAVAAALAVALAGCGPDADESPSRQDVVAQRGADVMPFDLDATTHHFIKKEDGVLEKVVADDPEDREQIRLVREHLAKEAARFEAGDFGDPAHIHGEQMPGLAQLESGAEDFSVEYQPLPRGGQIRMTTDRDGLVEALHAWADAQVIDHGEHAE